MLPCNNAGSQMHTNPSSSRRLRVLYGHLVNSHGTLQQNGSSAHQGDSLHRSPVPHQLLPYINWLHQKKQLHQNALLLGHPGPLRRYVAKSFARSTLPKEQTPYEYYYITEHTTDADLKQRKELVDSSMQFVDQCVVRAALTGKVLILEGLENAERNVLALLNGLLEERKMVLDDGRVLCDPEDLSHHTSQLHQFTPIHKDFFIICLSLPIPPYTGLPLDPPLRSRFQAKALNLHLHSLCVAILAQEYNERLNKLILNHLLQYSHFISHFADEMLQDKEPQASQLPLLPLHHLLDLYRLIHATQHSLSFSTMERILHQVYPYTILLNSLDDVSLKTSLLEHTNSTLHELYMTVHKSDTVDTSWRTRFEITTLNQEDSSATLLLKPQGTQRKNVSLRITIGTLHPTNSDSHYMPFESFEAALCNMILSHYLNRDFCVLGHSGGGRSTLVHEFCRRLCYEHRTFALNANMTVRELFKQRRTDQKGNTYWSESPLLECMRKGYLCVLDSIDLLPSDVAMSLQSLIQDREVFLEDGSHFCTDSLADSHSTLIHPSFRIVGVASTKSSREDQDPSSSSWIDDRGVLSLFHFHVLNPLSVREEERLIRSLIPKSSSSAIVQLLKFVHAYNSIIREEEVAEEFKTLSLDVKHYRTISLRESIQAIRRMTLFPESETLWDNILRMTLVKLVSIKEQEDFFRLTSKLGLSSESVQSEDLKIQEAPEIVSIGDVSLKILPTENPQLIPHTYFVENKDHTRILKALLKDHIMSCSSSSPVHSLLLGVQGSGKNRITDRFLELIHGEKEYLQLHRDSTIHSLTTTPSVEHGVIEYIDSPLIRAAKEGRILIMDEFDKAPVEIVEVLRSLLIDGEMILPSGKVLSSSSTYGEAHTIRIHPSFRVIALANPPSFPFHGNSVAVSMGDVFSMHLVSNPSEEQELLILRAYAPHVDVSVLSRLCGCFSDLRKLVQDEVISYPYSLRELVSVAKHLEKYPEYGLVDALQNVTDFELYDQSTFLLIEGVFNKHGIPLNKSTTVSISYSSKSDTIRFDNIVQNIPVTSYNGKIGFHQFVVKRSKVFESHSANEDSCQLTSHRTQRLSELQFTLHLPCKYPHQILSVDGEIHVLSSSPDRLYTYNADMNRVRMIELFHYARLSNIHLCILHGALFIVGLRYDDSIVSHTQSKQVVQLYEVNHFANSREPLKHAFSFEISEKMPNLSCMRPVFEDSPIVLYTNNNIWLIDTVKRKKKHARTKLLVSHIALPEKVFLSELFQLTPDTWLLQDTDKHFVLSLSADKQNLSQVSGAPAYMAVCPRSDSQYSVVEEKTFKLYEMVSRDTGFQINRPQKEILLPQAKRIGTRNIVAQKGHTLYLYTVSSSELMKISIGHSLTGQKGNDSDSEDSAHSSDEEDAAGIPYTQLIDACTSKEHLVTIHDDCVLRFFETRRAVLQEEEKQFKNTILGEGFSRASLEHGESSAPSGSTMNTEGEASMGGGGAGGAGAFGGTGGGIGGGPMGIGDREQSSQGPSNSQDTSANLSKEAQKKAKHEARMALLRRLKMIDMTEGDISLYQKHLKRVDSQISRLRKILQDLKAKEKEKKWLKGRSAGEIDENRLVEGLAGENAIYKKRGQDKDKRSLKQKKKKLLHFAMDCSASMFRFNGFDQRLDRMIDVAVLIMEALSGFESKFDYCITAHSGMSTRFPLVEFSKSPKNRKQRLNVVRKMMAHAQYCSAGDSTEAATYKGISALRKKEADERFFFCFSDANLDRYGFDTQEYSKQVSRYPTVETHLIFLASGNQQAERMHKELPKRTSLCFNSAELASTFAAIFKSAVLS